MNERSSLILVLMSLFVGSRASEQIGEGPFYAILAVGWAVALIWSVAAWRRGDKIFVWQDRKADQRKA